MTPKEHWPEEKGKGGVGMRGVGAPEGRGGGTWYEMTFSEEYIQVQGQYQAMVASMDPRNLMDLLHHHPSHIATLLQVAEYYAHTAEQQTAADMLERAVSSLERGFHPSFVESLGSARVDYSKEENRVLYHVLFRYMQSVSRRGCNRTALEVAKLIFSLDPENDPLGMLLCLDYLALRSRMFPFLLSFAEYYTNTPATHPNHHLPSLPNWAFSAALAQWNVEKTKGGEKTIEKGVEEEELKPLTAGEQLQVALRRFPGALGRILEKGCIVKDSGAWAEILSDPLFAAGDPETETDAHLIEVFVERSLALWKAPDVLAWLLLNARALVARRGKSGSGDPVLAAGPFPKLPYCIYKHILASNFSDAQVTIPQEEEAAVVPPEGRRNAEVPDNLNRLDLNANPLRLFFESMLPWNAAPFEGDAAGAAAGPGENADEDEAMAWALQQQELEDAQE